MGKHRTQGPAVRPSTAHYINRHELTLFRPQPPRPAKRGTTSMPFPPYHWRTAVALLFQCVPRRACLLCARHKAMCHVPGAFAVSIRPRAPSRHTGLTAVPRYSLSAASASAFSAASASAASLSGSRSSLKAQAQQQQQEKCDVMWEGR
jgi:hypothetical protein